MAVSLAIPLLARAEQPKTLLLVADTYCPYNCAVGAEPEGFAIDVMREIFEPKGYQIKYKVVPWTRALKMVKSGQADVALGSPPEEANTHGLVQGQEPIGYATDCLFVRADNTLQFNNRADDLNSLKRVGTVVDFQYYDQFGEWLKRPENQAKNFQARGDTASLTNLKQLVLGRLDGAIETLQVMDYLILQTQAKADVRVAGCQSQQQVFNLFSPARSDAKQLAAELDKGIVALRKNGRMAHILARYGMSLENPHNAPVVGR